MPENPWRRILDVVRRRTDPDATGPLADERLLARFVAHGDPSAFELLVWRHGSLVFGTCRRILGDAHAAEDAFQATFLALARKPRAVRSGAALAGWLHRVAVRIANRLCVSRARQSAIERRAARAIETATDDNGSEVVQVMDEEIDRLPARLRSAVVLCYLDGRTTDQAAEILGCPRGTVLSRLSTARDRLRDRLTRRGFTLPIAGISALMFASESPASLIPAAVRAALTGASPLITGLVQGVFHAMLLTKVKIATAVVLAIGLTGAGIGWVVVPGTRPAAVQAVEPQAPQANPNQKDAANFASRIDNSLALILEAKKSIHEKLEKAEQELQDHRLRHPYLSYRSGQGRVRLDTISAKRTELLIKQAQVTSRLNMMNSLFQQNLDGENKNRVARIALLKLQIAGVDVVVLRKLMSSGTDELSPYEFLMSYSAALNSDVLDLQANLNELEKLAETESTTLREVMHFEMQEERLRAAIDLNRKLLEVIVKRISEINLEKDRYSK